MQVQIVKYTNIISIIFICIFMLTGLSYFYYPQLFPNIFEIKHIKVIDSQQSKETDIREKISNLSDNLLLLDKQILQNEIEQVPWVKRANIKKIFPNKIQVQVIENDPYAIFLNEGVPFLIDLDGTIITQISDQSIDTSMIQILGEKANENLESLIKSINIHFPELLNDIKSLEYIELRRWNMKLRRDLKIKFPDEKIDQSIINLKRLFVEQNVSESNIIEIDLRIHGRASVKVLEGKVKFGVDEI
tara:strand:+ start:4177 stop:4914 length:738 start_codon:yes stop_codon:yes gene_type:complete